VAEQTSRHVNYVHEIRLHRVLTCTHSALCDVVRWRENDFALGYWHELALLLLEGGLVAHSNHRLAPSFFITCCGLRACMAMAMEWQEGSYVSVDFAGVPHELALLLLEAGLVVHSNHGLAPGFITICCGLRACMAMAMAGRELRVS
jgi:hypothetical protein